MPSFQERLKSKLNRLAEKEKTFANLNKSLANAQAKVNAAKEDIATIKAEILDLETRILTDTIMKKGISVSDIAAAIEAGMFEKSAPEKPPDKDKTDISVEENCATYSTETNNTSDKEDLDDEISSSGETVSGA